MHFTKPQFWVALFAFSLFSSKSYSEYRAYLLQVQANQPAGEPKVYAVVSSLDAKQYEELHGGASTLKVTALRSWMCFGHTGYYRDVCPDGNTTYSKGPFPVPANSASGP